MGLFDAIKSKFKNDGEFKYDAEKSERVSERSLEWGGDTNVKSDGEGA